MHIGRAHALQPEHLQQQARQRTEAEVAKSHPVTVAREAAPTGIGTAPAPTYHPVTDLIARQVEMIAASLPEFPPPPEVRAEAYEGTPPAPHVLDLSG